MAEHALTQALIDRLKVCPSCKTGTHRTARAEDGIPAGHVFEAAFHCGGTILVSNDGDYYVSAGCQVSLEAAMFDLQRDLREQFEDEQEEAA